jgi:GT2 family glycosyltransferase
MSDTQPVYPRSLDDDIAERPVQEDITVVIPTLGRGILETCLFYLASGTRWPGAILVVDQGRQPAVAAMVERLAQIGLRANYLPSMQRGRSAGINRGLERVDTPLVAITDDDCFVSANWIAALSDRLARHPQRIITGRVELAGAPEDEFCTVTDQHEHLYTKPQLKSHPFIGGNVGMTMEVVRRIGLFDEHPCLASAEDSDYGYRALRCGIPIAYDPSVVLYHFHWRDAKERMARYGDYARSQGGFYGTHLRSGDPLILLQTTRDLVRSPIRWLRGILRNDPEMAANGRAATLNLLPGITAGLRRSRTDSPPGTEADSGHVG